MKIYFVRHGAITAPNETKKYIGITNLPLTIKGENDVRGLAKRIASTFTNKQKPFIIASPLSRCQFTAEIIRDVLGCDSVSIDDNLREINLGSWENLEVQYIKEHEPQAYRNRGEDLMHYRIEGAETLEEAGQRFSKAVEDIACECEKKQLDSVIIVAHKGVTLSAIAQYQGMSINEAFGLAFPYCGSISFDTTTNSFEFGVFNRPDDHVIEELYKANQVPERVANHMKAVAKVTGAILRAIPDGMFSQQTRDNLYCAALLHDVCRTMANHPLEGAKVIGEAGYGEIADLVELHHGTDMPEALTADGILFLADKLVANDEVVSIEERFARSLEKCKTPEALAKHKLLHDKAKRIESMLIKSTGKSMDEILGGNE